MRKIDYIFLPSVFHTGMWLIAQILHWRANYPFERMHPKFEKEKLLNIPPPATIHTHILAESGFDELKEIYDILNRDNKCLVIIPIKDILAAVISRKRRNPRESALHIIDGLILIAQKLKDFNPLYFPLDLLTEPKSREMMMISIEKTLGVDFIEANNVSTKEFSEQWPVINDTTTYCQKNHGILNLELKQAYDLGEIDYIKHVLPKEWSYLIRKRRTLQPFFERLGYTNLMWFRKPHK